MRYSILLFAAMAILAPHVADAQKKRAALTLSHCVVSLLDEAQIPAKKPGVIVKFAVAEGASVKAGDVVAAIDDAEAQVQLIVAERQLEAAQKESANDVDVRYAEKAAEVAAAELAAARQTNRGGLKAVPQSEIRRLELAKDRAALGIEQARFKFGIAEISSIVREAERNAAQLEVDTRQIKSPIDGVVVRLHRHEGEWANLGDPICHVVRLDRLRVTGFVNINEHKPSQVVGRPAQVRVKTVDDKHDGKSGDEMNKPFDCVIGFASPLVQPGGEYRIWAEVTNRRRAGFWVLRPGQVAQMEIELQ